MHGSYGRNEHNKLMHKIFSVVFIKEINWSMPLETNPDYDRIVMPLHFAGIVLLGRR
jgi:hypothetical protein